MKSVNLVFPGQGSQYVGMGSTFTGDMARATFASADTTLGYPLTELCFKGPEETLRLTENTQPAIVAHSVAYFRELAPVLEKNNIKIASVLGHSVGEYAALVAAGVLSLEDSLKAVRLRGLAMQQAVPVGMGKMVAILKIDASWAERACEAVSTDAEKVMAANYNDPKQTVISGHANACDRAVKWLEENCQERHGAIALNVSAPFHSSLMEPAAKAMAEHLAQVQFHPSKLPYVANVDAKFYPAGINPDGIRQRLVEQVCGAVRWTASIEACKESPYFIEVGPGKVLAGLIKRINPEAKILSLDTPDSWQKLEELFA